MYSNEYTLQDLLAKAYHRLDMDETVSEMEVKKAYAIVVGDFINRLTESVKFKNGVLRLKLSSAALRQELYYRRDGMMDRINEILDGSVVKRIEML